MNAPTQPTLPHELAPAPETLLNQLPPALSRLRRACAALDAAVAESGDDRAVLSERVNELQDALRGFERAELTPGDEHVDDYNARLARVTDDVPGHLRDLPLARVVAYIALCATTGARGWRRVEGSEVEGLGADGTHGGYRWRCGFTFVRVDASSTARTLLRSVATCEGRPLGAVLTDVLAPDLDPARSLAGAA